VRGLGGQARRLKVLGGALFRREKCLPLYKGPAGESFGRVLRKSSKNYFWGSKSARICELGVTSEMILVFLVHLI
jgi:hypothetical protein